MNVGGGVLLQIKLAYWQPQKPYTDVHMLLQLQFCMQNYGVLEEKYLCINKISQLHI